MASPARLAAIASIAVIGASCSLRRSPIVDREGGDLDASTGDAPDRDAPADDVPRRDAACDPTTCDDGDPCTDDRCLSSGCDHVANAASCDDGLFCTVGETCSAGRCGEGSPRCPFCDEDRDGCGACDDASGCPEATVGTCVYADLCDESGTQTTTTYACVDRACVPTDVVAPCVRETDAMPCGPPVSEMGACEGTGRGCSGGGVRTTTTTVFRCVGGACTPGSSSTDEVCVHDPTGDACVGCGACEPAMPASCAGLRRCSTGACGGVGLCVVGGTMKMEACNVAPGTGCSDSSCGPCMRGERGTCTRTCMVRSGFCDAVGGCTALGAATPVITACGPAECGG